MTKPVSSGKRGQMSLKALNGRAEAILKARPAYKEMVDFYLTVFRRQIEWRDKLIVRPETLDDDKRCRCLRQGKPLLECFDPGIDGGSMLLLWVEMKAVFGRGNDVLRDAIRKVELAEESGDFAPPAWLPDQRPDRPELVKDAGLKIGIEESILASLARAVTLPHWELVAREWLPHAHLDDWGRFRCPTCGGPPGLAENRKGRSVQDGIAAAPQRYMHCPFCTSRWAVRAIECSACGSKKAGDAKYLFASDEPDLRIDFCKSCHHYVKVVDGDKVSGPIHVGLELLTAAHLDMIAQDKGLSPLEVCA